MRRTWLGVFATTAGLVLIPASPAHAEETCGGLAVTISGTEGNDVINGTEGNDVISAKGGNDRVLALGGHDIACLGTGDDFFDGGAFVDRVFAEAGPDGSDIFFGGPDQDFVDYSLRTVPLRITLDGIANDGAAGEGDHVVVKAPNETGYGGNAVEGVVGGRANDHIQGQDGLFQHELTNLLSGGPGDDTIIGGSARDQLHGDGGNDTIEGRADEDFVMGFDGNDVLDAGSGFDQVGGGAGDDILIGGPDGDLMGGSTGNDVFIADPVVDGSDAINGHTGYDVVSYRARTAGVTAKPLFFGADPAIEDQISTDVEEIVGGSGNDVIDIITKGGVGNDNVVRGGPGDDRINVTDDVRGNDRIFGDDGNDLCRADRGDVKVSCP